MKWEITGTVDVKLGKIYLTSLMNGEGYDGHKMFEHIAHEVYNTKEKVVRKALIKLGWTPPKEKKKRCKDCIQGCRWAGGKKRKVCVNWRGVK